jgi:hypothetical protein
MGVAPEAIVKKSFEYRLKYNAPHLHISTRNSFNDKYHRGCAQRFLMVVAPEAIIEESFVNSLRQ